MFNIFTTLQMSTTKSLLQRIKEDVRYKEGINACMNCGACTAICPAAEFFEYDPRVLLNIVQSQDEGKLEALLKSDFIWYCGQCMSCKTRCPRNNCPGLIINVLRKVSQETGYFTHSTKGRQQLAIKRNTGDSILKYGYCVHPDILNPEKHPEQGPVWKWIYDHREDLYERMNANLHKHGAGTMRNIDPEVMDELNEIFKVTGGIDFFDCIEEYSLEKAREMGLAEPDGNMDRYIEKIENE